MISTSTVGLYGKLPAHGDFIYRNLPSNFINAWDAWLQSFVGSSQEQIGEHWLDVYLTSPIWRFVLSDGVIDSNQWAGIVLPSVDRVGRYFPFSIAARLTNNVNSFEVIKHSVWFETVENLALKALSGQLHIDDLALELGQHTLEVPSAYKPLTSTPQQPGALIQFAEETQPLDTTFARLLDASCKEQFASYSVWATAYGSERVDPCLFYTPNLPPLRSVAAMLDGEWAVRGWHQPYERKAQALPL